MDYIDFKGHQIPNLQAKDIDQGNVILREIRTNSHGDVIRGTATKPKRLTYLGVPAVSWEVRERGARGKRTGYVLWLEDAVGQDTVWPAGSITASTYRGSYSNGTLHRYNLPHLVTEEDLA